MAMNFALDVIFWRRWLYFALLTATVALLMSRFFLSYQNQGACDGTRVKAGACWEELVNLPARIEREKLEAIIREQVGNALRFTVQRVRLLS